MSRIVYLDPQCIQTVLRKKYEKQVNKYAKALKVLMDMHGGKPSSIHPGHWKELLQAAHLNESMLRKYISEIL